MKTALMFRWSSVAMVIVACDSASQPAAPAIEAMSFASAEWSDPVNLGAPINSGFNEMNPALSPDELSLYFVSTRPGGFGGADIWVSHRASLDGPWGDPVNLGPGINGPGIDASPQVSLGGHLLFFSSDRPGGQGQNDIYVSHRDETRDDLGWGPAVDLGPDVNTTTFEAGEFYLQSAEAGADNLYFSHGANSVDLDIYVAPIKADGETVGPATLVPELSISEPGITDAHPSVRVDGREIYFYSNRAGGLGASDLYRSSRRSVRDSWSTPENLGAPLSSSANDIQPTLSYSGRTLVFASNRAGGLGNSDIWMSTRAPGGH